MLAQSSLAFAEPAENFRWRFFSLTRLFRHPTPARFWPSSCACACPRRHGCASWTLSQSDCPHQLDSLTSSLAPSRTESTFPPRQPCFPLSASVICRTYCLRKSPALGFGNTGSFQFFRGGQEQPLQVLVTWLLSVWTTPPLSLRLRILPPTTNAALVM